jgi:alkanesulfonate monooxygenase SsuD/methylene tetrahydromethanopterin reductase-like flavin-dependent oxidoreductase (luciferase family)
LAGWQDIAQAKGEKGGAAYIKTAEQGSERRYGVRRVRERHSQSQKDQSIGKDQEKGPEDEEHEQGERTISAVKLLSASSRGQYTNEGGPRIPRNEEEKTGDAEPTDWAAGQNNGLEGVQQDEGKKNVTGQKRCEMHKVHFKGSRRIRLFSSSDGKLDCMKKLGFLSFGHWTPSPHSETQSAADALLQSIDLAVEAESLGMDGAYFRVHHFAEQLASPFPLLAAAGAKTRKIEIGTAVIDMRYENPHYMAEDAGAADLISGGRLQLGISRGSPEQVIDGWRHFGYSPIEGEDDAEMGRRHAEQFLELLRGKGFARPNPRPMFPNPPGLLRLEPYSEGLRDRIWWGSASNATAVWAARLGMNLQTSTLKFDETGEPLHIQQTAQIRSFRAAWKQAGHPRSPRVSVSRSIFPLIDDRDRAYFGRGRQEEDQVGFLDETTRAIFGRSYAAEPDIIIEQLKKDEAIAEADTLLLTIPNQLGVAYNAHVMEAILTTVAPALGWR